jgi:NADH dehydrogenase/NADH:ubiquinone oxidoreductase subunit G
MPEIFINGQPVAAEPHETVLQAALRNGYFIPYFCWHKSLSIAGNCRICVVQPEGKDWVEIACNMPVAEGMRVLTDSELVREHRKMTLQFILLNHPVDCGICDKAGECTLQDYHYAYNGELAVSTVPKVKSTKFVELSKRIVLDNERCILCTRCVRFTREISGSNALGVKQRGDEWRLLALDPRQNVSIARVTPRENPQVNGPWICNKGRDLAQIFERPRATDAMQKGRPVDLPAALAAARNLLAAARKPVALVSSWGSNEELEACAKALGGRVQAFVKADHVPADGEVVEDRLLIRADKNPNTAAARRLFGDAPIRFDEGTDLVLVWGEGFGFAQLPPGAKVIFLGAYVAPENGYADVFVPVSVQTERAGHYTNFEGVVSAFAACFPKAPGVADAEAVFAALVQS